MGQVKQQSSKRRSWQGRKGILASSSSSSCNRIKYTPHCGEKERIALSNRMQNQGEISNPGVPPYTVHMQYYEYQSWQVKLLDLYIYAIYGRALESRMEWSDTRSTHCPSGGARHWTRSYNN
ncbi:GD24629 [Drosophila simulans]|uniref:GD24629 n=1 Tax=Drosophila simulans TaxID=7240 RepID=B4NTW1_DROSI|nr:GD24629 [Drosophila simulans]